MLLNLVGIVLFVYQIGDASGQNNETVEGVFSPQLTNDASLNKWIENLDNFEKTLTKSAEVREKFDHWIDGNTWVNKKTKKKQYDFIIVGSGSAGAVIASRLSEIPEWNVLLLEAGVPDTLFMNIPYLSGVYTYKPEHKWDYYTEAQQNFGSGLINRKVHLPRGKSLGGCTSMNGMLYTRGHPTDYAKWAALGNPGWSYKDVLPYFLKSENASASLRFKDPLYHHEGGYLSIEDEYYFQMIDLFFRAGRELGLPEIDCNSPRIPLGLCSPVGTLMQGNRLSVTKAFLEPVRNRTNLEVITGALVTKILINPQTKTAYGVQYEKNNQLFKVKTSKEVIVSGGTINSPQLLMLSGIGPADHLLEMGIPLIRNLPVGRNLRDHLTLRSIVYLTNSTVPSRNQFTSENFDTFLNTGGGPLVTLGGLAAIAFIQSEVSTENTTQPDLEIRVEISLLDFLKRRLEEISDRVYDGLLKPIENHTLYTIVPEILQPKSSGYLKLRSKNPRDFPLIHSNYLSDPGNEDVKTMIAGIRFIQKLAKTEASQSIGSTLNPNPQPGCEQHKFDSDNYWECCVRSLGLSADHLTGTNSMGPKNNSKSVVDYELRVYGVKNLRVSDASVIPICPTGHTNAPTIMVGEKTADIIKSNYNKLPKPKIP